jgi:hypothetical protein
MPVYHLSPPPNFATGKKPVDDNLHSSPKVFLFPTIWASFPQDFYG